MGEQDVIRLQEVLRSLEGNIRDTYRDRGIQRVTQV